MIAKLFGAGTWAGWRRASAAMRFTANQDSRSMVKTEESFR